MFQKLAKKMKLFSLFALIAAFAMTSQAEAHYFSIIARDNDTVTPVSEERQMIVSFTHIFTQAQFNADMFGKDASLFSATAHYSDGTSAAFPAFTDYDDPNGIEVEWMIEQFPQYAGLLRSEDSYLSSRTIDKEGTVILIAEVRDMPMSEEASYTGFSKHIINAEADGYSTTAVATASTLEIVPVQDVAGAEIGTTLTFQVLYDGEPVEGASIEWADEEAEIVIGEEGHENLATLEALSDAEGKFTFTPQNGGLQFLGVMLALDNGDYASATLIFGTEVYSNDSSGSCNAGSFGGMLLLACLAALPFAKRALKRKSF